MNGLLAGKRGLIMGLANERSLAWGIARAARAAGAELAFSYMGDALEKRVRPLAAELGSDLLIECDVSDGAQIDRAFAELGQRWDSLDFVVHAIGFSDKNELRGRYVDTSLENFLMTMNISAYSFTAVAKRALPMMKAGGALLTLTYYGAEKVVPHYNVMRGQGGFGGERALSRSRSRARGRACERDFGGADQDAGGKRHRRLPLHP